MAEEIENIEDFEATFLSEIIDIAELPLADQPTKFNELRDRLESELGSH
jgi:hypothetical protein